MKKQQNSPITTIINNGRIMYIIFGLLAMGMGGLIFYFLYSENKIGFSSVGEIIPLLFAVVCFIAGFFIFFGSKLVYLDERKKIIVEETTSVFGKKSTTTPFSDFEYVVIKKEEKYVSSSSNRNSSRTRRLKIIYPVTLQGKKQFSLESASENYISSRNFAESIAKKMHLNIMDKSGNSGEEIRKVDEMDMSVKEKMKKKAEAIKIPTKPMQTKAKYEKKQGKFIIEVGDSKRERISELAPFLFIFIFIAIPIFSPLVVKIQQVKKANDFFNVFKDLFLFQEINSYLVIGFFAIIFLVITLSLKQKKETVILERNDFTVLNKKWFLSKVVLPISEIEEVFAIKNEGSRNSSWKRMAGLGVSLFLTKALNNANTNRSYSTSRTNIYSNLKNKNKEKGIKIISDKKVIHILASLKQDELEYAEAMIKSNL